MGSVSSGQRFRNASTPCPICGGFDSAPRGKGVRCNGFVSDDGDYVHCSREDKAGSITISASSETYGHRMHGDCKCGVSHGEAKPLQERYTDPKPRHIVASYEYVDQNGDYLYTAVKQSDKSFYQHRKGEKGLGEVQTTLYKLPDVIAARDAGDTIYLVEGEKDADTLNALGFVATTNSGGAKAWKKRHAEWLKGASRVVLVPDLDEAGYKLTLDRVADLEVLKVPYSIKLPDQTLQPKSDVTDHIEAGHAVEDMLEVNVERVATLHAEAERKRKEKAEPFTPYPLVHATDIRPPTTSNYLIKGLIEARAMAALYGQSASTKSFLAQEIGMCIGSGVEWRGQRTTKGRVIYVAAEGANGMRKRISAAMDHQEYGRDNIDFLLCPKNVSLCPDDDEVKDFVRTVQEYGGGEDVALVVIDTLSRAMAGMDENGPDMAKAVKQMGEGIMDVLNCAVLIVHHSGKKEAAGMRGHTSLRAALDTELELRKDDSGIATMTITKQKDGDEGGTYMHRLETVELGTDQDGDPIKTAILVPLQTDEVAAVQVAKQGGKKSSIGLEAVAACFDLHNANRMQPVPREVLAESTYLDWVTEKGFDPDVKVMGMPRRAFLTFLEDRHDGIYDPTDDEITNNPEDVKKERARRYAAAKRRLDAAHKVRAVFTHGDWVWLAETSQDKS